MARRCLNIVLVLGLLVAGPGAAARSDGENAFAEVRSPASESIIVGAEVPVDVYVECTDAGAVSSHLDLTVTPQAQGTIVDERDVVGPPVGLVSGSVWPPDGQARYRLIVSLKCVNEDGVFIDYYAVQVFFTLVPELSVQPTDDARAYSDCSHPPAPAVCDAALAVSGTGEASCAGMCVAVSAARPAACSGSCVAASAVEDSSCVGACIAIAPHGDVDGTYGAVTLVGDAESRSAASVAFTGTGRATARQGTAITLLGPEATGVQTVTGTGPSTARGDCLLIVFCRAVAVSALGPATAGGHCSYPCQFVAASVANDATSTHGCGYQHCVAGMAVSGAGDAHASNANCPDAWWSTCGGVASVAGGHARGGLVSAGLTGRADPAPLCGQWYLGIVMLYHACTIVAAASAVDDANGGYVSASGTGAATTNHFDDCVHVALVGPVCPTRLAASGTGDATGGAVSASGTGDARAEGRCLALSVCTSAAAVSLTGDAEGDHAVSLTGHASGSQTSVSLCDAEATLCMDPA